jgi:hypothetical protein
MGVIYDRLCVLSYFQSFSVEMCILYLLTQVKPLFW